MTRRAPEQAWTAEPWEADGVLIVTSESRLILFEVGGWDTGANEDTAIAAKIAADHNVLADLRDPAEWRRAVDDLTVAAREFRAAINRGELRDWNVSVICDCSKKVDALLALEEPREENSDGE